MMSDPDDRPELDAKHDELGEAAFDEEALRARRRQYGIAVAATALAIAAILAIPWRDSVQASGRIAPQRWAHVHSEAPGVVREVMHTAGDSVEEGDLIAVLDSDEQRDALEAARLALARQRQKLADLELRLRENTILREGADAVAQFAGERAVAAERIDGSRIAALDPAADAALDGVRKFATEVRAQMSRDQSARAEAAFEGEELHRTARSAMSRYSERAATVANHLTKVAGPEAGRQFRFELDDVHFSYALADHSMEEILMKYDLVAQGLLAPVTLRALVLELERETMELAHGFRALAGSARSLLGSRAEQSERVRGSEESRRLLANESERLESERSIVMSEIAEAELSVRAAERHQGKTEIRAPIRGTLAGESLAHFDAVAANGSVGVVEDAGQLVAKVHVDATDLRRIEVGQAVEARARGGRALRGAVTWMVPLAGQEVRDQEWNVLIQLEGDGAGVALGEKVVAAIDVGRRSLLRRWFKPEEEVATEPRIAFVEDPTELRASGMVRKLGVVGHEQVASEPPDMENHADGG
jgi:multidrug resistance efflux pump